MKKLISITQAAEATGLSQYELRAGAKAGRYPYLRAGGEKRGTILFNVDLLEQAITRQMLANVMPDTGNQSGYIRPILDESSNATRPIRIAK